MESYQAEMEWHDLCCSGGVLRPAKTTQHLNEILLDIYKNTRYCHCLESAKYVNHIW